MKLKSTYLMTGIFTLATLGFMMVFVSKSGYYKARRTFDIPEYSVRGPLPWNVLNEPTKRSFLMDGKVQLLHNALLFGNSHVNSDTVIDYDSDICPTYSRDQFDKLIKQAEKAELPISAYGGLAEKDLRDAFKKFPVKGKSVLIVGTLVPWIEVICYVLDAKDIYTVDFNEPNFDHPAFHTLDFEALNKLNLNFDVIVSYSSLEHDGVGRYGDPINPNADLYRMQNLKSFIKPNGFFFLAVPNGRDALVWNWHRIYGPNRFNELIKGWKLLDTFADNRTDIFELPLGDFYQAVHVLRLE